jgi:hypothetical protein
MELDYRKGQELLKQEDAFNKDLFDASNNYIIRNPGHLSKQEDVDKANNFFKSNLDKISTEVNSGKLNAREGVNRIKQLSDFYKTDKSVQGLLMDSQATWGEKGFEAQRSTGKLKQGVGAFGPKGRAGSVYIDESNNLHVEKADASQLKDLVGAGAYGVEIPKNALEKYKEFYSYIEPETVAQEIERPGFSITKNGQNYVYSTNKGSFTREEVTRQALRNLATPFVNANMETNPDFEWDRRINMTDVYGFDAAKEKEINNIVNSFPGYFKKEATKNEATINPFGPSKPTNPDPNPPPPSTSLKTPAVTVEIQKQQLPKNAEGKVQLHVPNAFSNAYQQLPFGSSEADKPFMKYSNQELNAVKSYIQSNQKTEKNWGHLLKNNFINQNSTSNVLSLGTVQKLIKEINSSGYLENYNKLMETDGATILTSPTSTIMSESLLQGLFGPKIGSSNLNVSHIITRFGENYPIYDKTTGEETTLKKVRDGNLLHITDKAYLSQTSYDDVTGLLLGENYYKPIVISLAGHEYLMPNQLKADNNSPNSQEINIEQVLVEASKIHNLSNSIKQTQRDGIQVFKNTPYPGIAKYNPKNIDKEGNLIPFILEGKGYKLEAQSADELAVLHNQYVSQQFLNKKRK